MEYTLTYGGKAYKLPRFTNAIRRKMEEVASQNAVVDSETRYKNLHNLVKEIVGTDNATEIFGSDDFEEIDLAELNAVYLKIGYTYDSIVDKVKRESAISPEDKKMVMDFLKQSGNMNELTKRFEAGNQGLRVLR